LFYRGGDDRHSCYDFTLYGAKNDVILAVKGYRGMRTSKDADASLYNAASFAEPAKN
jgi:hypothetical protein